MNETMQPFVWNDLPSIHEVTRPDESDEKCLEEIRGVLEKYQKVGRFGLALLHNHFKLGADEVLVEHCDIEQRKLMTAPMSAAEAARRKYIPTLWRFDEKGNSGCAFCPMHGDVHDGYKEPCLG